MKVEKQFEKYIDYAELGRGDCFQFLGDYSDIYMRTNEGFVSLEAGFHYDNTDRCTDEVVILNAKVVIENY